MPGSPFPSIKPPFIPTSATVIFVTDRFRILCTLAGLQLAGLLAGAAPKTLLTDTARDLVVPMLAPTLPPRSREVPQATDADVELFCQCVIVP
jgi:hypothetical protein